MKRKIVFVSIIVLLLLVAAVSVFQIIKISMDYKKADDIYEDLQNKYVDTIPQESEGTEPDQSEDDTTDTTTVDTAPKETQADCIPITINFDALLEDNKDIVGWLYCPNTPINYPVVQAKDNNKYLRADLNGKYLVSGTLFVDYRNGAVGENRNYIIYGHNMKNGTMFGSLLKYKEQWYYDAHPTVYYLTPDNDYTIELIAGMVVKSTDMIYQADPSSEAYMAYLDKAAKKSTFQSYVTISNEDILIVFSTCSYEFDGARYVVIGRIAG